MGRPNWVESLAVFGVMAMAACGEGSNQPSVPAPTASSSGGAREASGGGPASATGGTETGGSAGAPGTGGAAPVAEGGTVSGLPPATEQEAEILAPLFADDSLVQGATGTDPAIACSTYNARAHLLPCDG